MVAKGVCRGGEIDDGKQLLLWIASMLIKLIESFDFPSSSSSSSIIREEPVEEEFEDEDKNENEDEHAH